MYLQMILRSGSMGEMADNDFFDKLNELKLDGYIELPKKKENKT